MKHPRRLKYVNALVKPSSGNTMIIAHSKVLGIRS